MNKIKLFYQKFFHLGEDNRESYVYRRKAKIMDAADDSQLMRLNHLIAHPRVRLVISIAVVFLITIAGYLVINAIDYQLSEGIRNTFSGQKNKGFWYYFVPQQHFAFYFFFFCAGSVAAVKLYYDIGISYGDFNKNQKGSARFTTIEEIQEQYRCVPAHMESVHSTYFGKPGFPVTHYEGNIYIDDTAVNNLVIGITRSGKGEMVIFSGIDLYSRAEHKRYVYKDGILKAYDIYYDPKDGYKEKVDTVNNVTSFTDAVAKSIMEKYEDIVEEGKHFDVDYRASMVISDPKLELSAGSIPTLRERGYLCYVINLIDPLNSAGFNPLTLIMERYKAGDSGDAELLARTFAYSIFAGEGETTGDNAFFYDNATFATTAMILAEVIDAIDADLMEDSIHKKRWEEATEKYNSLPEEEKEQLQEEARELEELLLQYDAEENIIQKISIEKSIKEKQRLLADYNYNEKAYQPYHENEKKVNMYNILHKFKILEGKKYKRGKELVSALDLFFESRDELDIARSNFDAIKVAGEGKTKGSVYSTVLSKLNFLSAEKLGMMMAESTFRLEDIGFGDRPVAVFLGMPDYDTSNIAVISIFIKQVYFILAKLATFNKTGRTKRDVVFHLDEAGNMYPIADIDTMVTVCLGRGLRFNFAVQAYSQFQGKYGDEVSATINANCGNHIYIMTNSNDTAEEFSKLLGNESITSITRMGKKLSINKQITESIEEKPLLNPNQLMEFTNGQAVVRRTMFRTDLKGRDVKPRPIYSHDETRFLFRYQYMLDYFPSGRKLSDVYQGDRSCIDLRYGGYVSDLPAIIKEIEKQQSEIMQIKWKMFCDGFESNSNIPLGEMEVQDRSLIIQYLKNYYEELAAEEDDAFLVLTINDILKNIIKYPSRILIFKKMLLSGGVTWGDFEDFDEEDFEGELTEESHETDDEINGIKMQDINMEMFKKSFRTLVLSIQEQIEELGIESKLPYFLDSNCNSAFHCPSLPFSEFKNFVLGRYDKKVYIHSLQEYEVMQQEMKMLSFIIDDFCKMYDEMYCDMDVYIRREG